MERQVIIDDRNSLLGQTRRLLQRHGLRARKGLGQHFLINSAAIEMSVSAAELTPQDTVIEVGPGLGVLTERLAHAAGEVIVIELDSKIAAILEQRFADTPSITVINEDILQQDIKATFERSGLSDTSYKVVANLPYYVAAPTIRYFLEADIKPQKMVLMVQKEVAENMVAEPGNTGIFGISVQVYGRPTIIGYVPAEDFHPPPKVDSAIVHIDVYQKPAIEADIGEFFRVVKAGFFAPRKQLRNSLAKGLGIDNAESARLLEKARIPHQRRAETLTLEEWDYLTKIVIEKGN